MAWRPCCVSMATVTGWFCADAALAPNSANAAMAKQADGSRWNPPAKSAAMESSARPPEDATASESRQYGSCSNRQGRVHDFEGIQTASQTKTANAASNESEASAANARIAQGLSGVTRVLARSLKRPRATWPTFAGSNRLSAASIGAGSEGNWPSDRKSV